MTEARVGQAVPDASEPASDGDAHFVRHSLTYWLRYRQLHKHGYRMGEREANNRIRPLVVRPSINVR